MIHDHFQKLVFEIADQRRINANSDRVGYVHEVQKDKIRVVMGIRPDGTPWLSPWLHTTDHRGGSRERKMYEKGQNVRISSPNGDHRQATVTPWAESNSHPAPAHADEAGASSETFQMGKLRVAKVKKASGGQSGGGSSGGGGTSTALHVGPSLREVISPRLGVVAESTDFPTAEQTEGDTSGDQSAGDSDHTYDIWMAEEDDQPPAHQEQSGKPTAGSFGGASTGAAPTAAKQQQGQGQGKAGTPAMKMRISESGYITGRVGKNIRFAAHKEGAKIRAGKHWFVATEKKLIMSDPPVIGKDPVPNDDK